MIKFSFPSSEYLLGRKIHDRGGTKRQIDLLT